jgi:hypothetical protein
MKHSVISPRSFQAFFLLFSCFQQQPRWFAWLNVAETSKHSFGRMRYRAPLSCSKGRSGHDQ